MGIKVFGLSADTRAYGNFSRWCEPRMVPDSQKNPEQLLEYLLRQHPLEPGTIIFPTRDADVLFLDAFREELRERYVLAVPERECLVRTMDKYELVRAAAEAGVAVPRTFKIASEKDLPSVARLVGFPCVGKPVSSAQWRVGNAWNQVGARKAFRANNERELQTLYQQVSQVTPEILVQEWIPGEVEEIVVVGAYVGDDSEPLSFFTARKIVQSPKEFGTGCVVRSEHLPQLLEPTCRMWKALDYTGMAEVEYKRDCRTGEYKLVEINTRHWDQHQLGSASGVNLSYCAYCHLAGLPVPSINNPTQTATWIAEDALLLHLLAGFIGQEERITGLRSKLSGKRMYGILDRSDPWPFLRYSLTVLLPGLARSGGKWIKKRVRVRSLRNHQYT